MVKSAILWVGILCMLQLLVPSSPRTPSIVTVSVTSKQAHAQAYWSLDAATARAAYAQAVARLLAQRRFELDDVLHFGVRSQPEYYYWRLRAITPDRFEAVRNDRPPFSLVQVGRVQCDGPGQWFCGRGTFPPLSDTVRGWLVPRPQLTHVTFAAKETPAAVIITIRAHGDPWQCPPIAMTCLITGFDERSFQDRSRYTVTLVVDRPSGLPGSLVSSVAMGIYGRHFPLAVRRSLISPAQRITFSYGSLFGVDLPHYRKLKCPGGNEPGTWCMNQPGA